MKELYFWVISFQKQINTQRILSKKKKEDTEDILFSSQFFCWLDTTVSARFPKYVLKALSKNVLKPLFYFSSNS